MPPQEVDTALSAIQVNGEPRDAFTETDGAALHCDPDAPFHALLESIKASTTLPSQPSSGPTSPISVDTFQAPSNLGSYAPSETATDTDTMITWQPAESVAEPLVESYTEEAPVVEDERPDTPVGPRIDVHHHQQPQGFETPQRRTLAGLAGSSRSRSTLRLNELREPELFDGTTGKKCCQFIQSVRDYAWKSGKHSDPGWIAGYAGTRLTDDALAWHSRQPPEVTDDWKRLQDALIETFYPNYREGSISSPGTSPGTTPSSRTAFSPTSSAAPSSSSSDGPISPQLLSPDLSSSTLLSPPSGSVRAPSQLSGPRSLTTPSHISLASESSQKLQCGQLLVVDNNGRSYYLRIRLSKRGGCCKPTSDRSESLRVRNATGLSRRLYLDNIASHYAALGIAWCIKRNHTPHLSKGSFDCADLVYLDNKGTSSSKDAHGPSRDTIWMVKEDNSVQVLWRDNEQIEHELHAVMRPEPESFFESLRSPARVVLVKDPDAFIPNHPGYIRSRFVFEP